MTTPSFKSGEEFRNSAATLDHSLQAQQVEHQMSRVMKIFDAPRARVEFLEFDLAIPRIHPNGRAMIFQREFFLHVAPGSAEPVSGPRHARVFDQKHRP